MISKEKVGLAQCLSLVRLWRRFPNLLYRRFPIGAGWPIPKRWKSETLAGLETRDMADLEVNICQGKAGWEMALSFLGEYRKGGMAALELENQCRVRAERAWA